MCHGENSEDIQFIKVNEICARSGSVEIESEIEVDGEYSEVEVNYTVYESVHSDNSDCQQSACEEDNFKGFTKEDLYKNSEKTEAFKKLLKKAEKKVQKNKIDFLIKKRSYLKKNLRLNKKLEKLNHAVNRLKRQSFPRDCKAIVN